MSNEIMEFLEQIVELFESADGVLAAIGVVILAVISLIELLISVFGIAIIIAALLISVVIAIVTYLFRAVPLYTLGRKAKCKYAWLIWIPFFQDIISVFLMSKISGKEEFELFNGKLRIKQNLLVMLGYVMIYFFGATMVTFLVAVLNVIPGIGQVASLIATILYYVPAFTLAVIEYTYLRDLLGVFKPNEKKNQIHAFVIVILDTLLTHGWAGIIYMITMMRLKPLIKR